MPKDAPTPQLLARARAEATTGSASVSPAATPPTSLAGRAADDLAFVRDVVARSAHFTAVPGRGGVAMGLIALAAAPVAARQAAPLAWLGIWLAAAALAATVGAVALVHKARATGASLEATPARRFAFGLVPPLLAGALLTVGAWRMDARALIVPIWLLCYGLAIAAAGAVSAVRLVPRLGLVFMAFGAVALALPLRWHDLVMATGFGGAHLVAGFLIWRHHGG